MANTNMKTSPMGQHNGFTTSRRKNTIEYI
jgi:hypothetical protein